MKTTFAIGLLLSVTAAAEDAKTGRLRVSGNGTYGVRMVEVGPDKCRLEVLRDNDPLWQLDKCVGNAEDYYFVSNDGTRFWILRTTPEKPGAPSGKKKGLPWYQVQVAALYDGTGNVIQSRRLMDMVEPKDREKVRQLGKHFIWLEGVNDVPGKKPRINDTGQVEFETVGTHTVKLNF